MEDRRGTDGHEHEAADDGPGRQRAPQGGAAVDGQPPTRSLDPARGPGAVGRPASHRCDLCGAVVAEARRLGPLRSGSLSVRQRARALRSGRGPPTSPDSARRG